MLIFIVYWLAKFDVSFESGFGVMVQNIIEWGVTLVNWQTSKCITSVFLLKLSWNFNQKLLYMRPYFDGHSLRMDVVIA